MSNENCDNITNLKAENTQAKQNLSCLAFPTRSRTKFLKLQLRTEVL